MASIWKNQLPFIRHVRQREWPVWGGATADSLWLKPCQVIVPVAVLKKTHFNHTIARCWNGSCIDSRADVGFVCGTIPHHLATVAKTQPSLTDTWFQAQTRNPKWVFMLALKSWLCKRSWVRRMWAGRVRNTACKTWTHGTQCGKQAYWVCLWLQHFIAAQIQ